MDKVIKYLYEVVVYFIMQLLYLFKCTFASTNIK